MTRADLLDTINDLAVTVFRDKIDAFPLGMQMLQGEDESEGPTATDAVDGVTESRGKRIADEVSFGARGEGLPRREFAARKTRNNGQHSSRELFPKNFFVTESWHGPYAHALMETDPVRLAPLIAEAENAIFSRYLELCLSPGLIEYSWDLQYATGVLREMKTRLQN